MWHKVSRVMRSGRHGMLVAMFSAALLTLAMLLAIPAKAQNTGASAQYASSKENGQQAQADATEKEDSQTATDPTGETARITESTTDSDEIVDRIVVPVAGCEVASDASVVVEDDDDTSVSLTNGQNVTIDPDDDTLTIVGTDADGNLTDLAPRGGDQQFGTEGQTATGEVLRSSGITCGRDAGGNNAEDDNGAENGPNEDDATARTADELRALSCEELLVLFRAEGGSTGQYGDAVALADADVRAQIEVCLEQEVVQGTAAGEDLPDTGGVSLLGLAVLGIVSAAAGLSVIHGGRR